MEMGLGAGEAPELWNVDAPDKVASLHRRFVDAGADVIRTNTFGCNRHRLTLHGAEHRVGEAGAGRRHDRRRGGRRVEPAGGGRRLGRLHRRALRAARPTEEAAAAVFGEQIVALRAGGAYVVVDRPASAPRRFAPQRGRRSPSACRWSWMCSFDTAGRTMINRAGRLSGWCSRPRRYPPVAIGANGGVGAPDILGVGAGDDRVALPRWCRGESRRPAVPGHRGWASDALADGCGRGPAADAGARIVGGRRGHDGRAPRGDASGARRSVALGERPTVESIVAGVGPLANTAPSAVGPPARERAACPLTAARLGQDGERRRRPYMPPSTASTVPVVDADCGDAR